ncbi:Ig-like domain-containing protein [Curtobacterium flaccumfaciens]|nr:Ig-like domain-containing protein [Curtobacterium flaccumfaciens]
MPLTNGVRSADGTKYTYDFSMASTTWNLPDASLMRWNIDVNTPEDAEAGTFPMRTVFSGTATEGAFNTTSTTQATVEAAEVPAPDALVVTTPADGSTVDSKRPVFSGTGDEGATIEIRDADDNLIATTVVKDGAWSVPATADLADGSYEFDVTQTPLAGAPSTEKVSFTVATNPLTTELTAVGAFDDDVTKPATISGDATTGATVIVKDSLGNEVGRTEAVDGKYSIPVPPSFAHTGVNDFTVTQTKNDTTSPEKDVSLDYGMPAPIRITSPANGSTVQKDGLTFTGTGDEGARIDVRGSVRAIATGTVTDGVWNAPVTIDLANNVYNLRAVQTTKGGLTTQVPITITITDEAPVAPLTATAAFNATDENLPAAITGSANPGATVTVKDSNGDTIGTAIATNGRYTITIPANKAHFGVNDFTVTQTVRGQVSAPLDRSLDYGNPAAPVIQTPANGATVTNGSIRFTGTGATGAKLDMRGNSSSVGDTKITDGAWTVDVTRQLNPGGLRPPRTPDQQGRPHPARQHHRHRPQRGSGCSADRDRRVQRHGREPARRDHRLRQPRRNRHREGQQRRHHRHRHRHQRPLHDHDPREQGPLRRQRLHRHPDRPRPGLRTTGPFPRLRQPRSPGHPDPGQRRHRHQRLHPLHRHRSHRRQARHARQQLLRR